MVYNDNKSVTNISPLDGRYFNKTKILKEFFSEFALFKYRLLVEINYLLELGIKNIITINNNDAKLINNIIKNFDINSVNEIKQIEKTTNHDIKALEYFIYNKLEKKIENKKILNYIHFCLTSQDINSTAYVLSMKQFNLTQLIPKIENILNILHSVILKTSNIVILAKTHGQPASPTYMGKEIHVFYERINIQLNKLKNIDYTTKFGGATGNFNAHIFAYPNIDWVQFGDNFIEKIGLKRNKHTTQIDHYDNYSEIFDILRRINTILIDFSQDIWLYISNNYFKLKTKKSDVGSSTMPHKINPINFENAEGNLYLSNSLFQLFSSKLPISRLQRDLTDSTILRNLGCAYGYMFIALLSLEEGINKLDINKPAIKLDLDQNYIVVAEAITNKLKVLNIESSYEKIKNITRNYDNIHTLKQNIEEFINELDIDNKHKKELLELTPESYVGIKPKYL